MSNNFKDSNNSEKTKEKINSNVIWHEFNAGLKSFIRKRVANENDAEDILQDVFLKVHRNIDTLKDNNRIHAWIYRITRNTIIDYYRKRDRNIELIEIDEDLIGEIEEEISINKEIGMCLNSMIQHMPEKYKQAIILTEFQNITQKKLAQELGMSISGAKSRVQRGRLMLKEALLDCCKIEFDRVGNVIDYKHKTKNCKFC